MSFSVFRFSFLRLIALFILFFPVYNLKAQNTLPPYHWANTYIDYLKLRGYLPALFKINRPYSRSQIADMLETVPIQQDLISKKDKAIINELILELEREKYFADTSLSKTQGMLGIFSRLDGSSAFVNTPGQTTVELHPEAALQFGKHFLLYGNFKIFNQADKYYIGKEFIGLYAYLEQAYAAFKNDWLEIKTGRDFLQLGPGKSGQLLISDNSRPFDLYQVNLSTSQIGFMFWGVQLNRRKNMQENPTTSWVNRYMNGHRLYFQLSKKYYFALSEVVVYGGPNANWETGLMNPVMMYHAYNMNTPGIDVNTFYTVEWDLYPWPNWEIYGEFLIDDIQVEKKTPEDLEPNELGLLVGVQWASAKINGLAFNLEYVQIRNRTYNAPDNDWEKYLHRNQVIGYKEGNDLEHYIFSGQYWPNASTRFTLFFSYLRKGEGTVRGPFNKDFLDYTVEEGYSEPFPTGVVQNGVTSGIKLFYKPLTSGFLELQAGYKKIENKEHVKNQNESGWFFSAALWYEWNKIFKL